MTYAESFSSTYLTRYITLALVRSSSSGSREMQVATYWIATLPSILPTAKPFAAGKQETTLVCHFNGDTIVYIRIGILVPISSPSAAKLG